MLTFFISNLKMDIKRVFDFFASFLLFLLFFLLITILIIFINVKIGRPIFFKQKRPGLHAKPFIMYKFRTMKDIYDANGQLLSDGERLTEFGKFLRKYSLDELPELINVLRGDMSLVGPRPLLMEYLPLYTKEQARRHEVRPGITGWAQINGRNAISWEEKFKLDIWYVDHRSFWLDLKILFLTLFKVLKCDSINQKGHATASKFDGTK